MSMTFGRINSPKGYIYTIKKGILTLQLSEDEMEETLFGLATLSKYSVMKKDHIKLLKQKANLYSTKKRPLGV